jgi:hypothetical protein
MMEQNHCQMSPSEAPAKSLIKNSLTCGRSAMEAFVAAAQVAVGTSVFRIVVVVCTAYVESKRP